MPVPASRLAVATALLLALGAAPATGDGAPTTTASEGPTPSQTATPVVPHDVHGRAAIDALGSRLSDIARRNGLTGARLKTILASDSTAWISETGQMYYRDTMPTTTSSSATTTALTYPASQTLHLHSRPGATKQIFLDFDGAALANSAWSATGRNSIASGTYTGYDSDGKPSSFSTAEAAWIQEVWREVSETYSPFDVDVTTEDQGQGARTKSTPTDPTYGTQVLFTNSASAMKQACATATDPNAACLGVAFVGTFGDTDPAGALQPAWVFTNKTMTPIIAAQGAAHEVGHTLGLTHDGTIAGTNTQAYYAGTSAWGPIMGSATFRAVSQFSRGEYKNANNKQDDFAVIQAQGLPLRRDDYGGSSDTAAQLGTQGSYAVKGVISTRSDRDVFAVNLRCRTTLTVSAAGIGHQTALDLRLDVINGSGTTVASSAPAASHTGTNATLVSTGMNASATVKGAIGTYYLRVDGVGYGSPTGSGWSDYGSLGQYRLTANGCATTTAQPTTVAANDTSSAARPSAPRIGRAAAGSRGGTSTALVRWLAPTDNGGAAVSKYRVMARRLNAQGRVVHSYGSAYVKPTARSLSMRLPKARYKFVVVAYNRVGASPASRVSNIVRAR